MKYMVSIIVIDEYLLVPLSDFNFHISYVNVLETELWAEGLPLTLCTE